MRTALALLAVMICLAFPQASNADYSYKLTIQKQPIILKVTPKGYMLHLAKQTSKAGPLKNGTLRVEFIPMTAMLWVSRGQNEFSISTLGLEYPEPKAPKIYAAGKWVYKEYSLNSDLSYSYRIHTISYL